MKRFSAVIFDMDGVIVDSEPRHAQAFREIFEELGYGENHGIVFADYIGRSDKAVWVDFIANHRPAHSLDQLMDRKKARFIDILHRDQPIFEGAERLIRKLHGTSRLAVASGSLHSVIEAVLKLNGLRPFFDAVSSVEDVARSKPAPDVFLHAAASLKVDPKDCCVIEDSTAGVQAGLAAGMTVIAITNSFPADQLKAAHYIVRDYDEIERLLLH
ncbi:MAG TPA: HAD family phosphatase [Candidatus Limnocylindria bacterium]|jgi:HAD superfamily hydrolase (TIGR01509 family)|nr:HAD family phosphatase [Candidatus Limnocylindria bacterium]